MGSKTFRSLPEGKYVTGLLSYEIGSITRQRMLSGVLVVGTKLRNWSSRRSLFFSVGGLDLRSAGNSWRGVTYH